MKKLHGGLLLALVMVAFIATVSGSRAAEGKSANAISSAAEWGTIMYPKPNTSIRAKRSSSSKINGQLKTGQPVKADFLRDDWYAVFDVAQKQRDVKRALGYVYAPLLIDKRGPNSTVSAVPEEMSAAATPVQKIETDGLDVGVKNITFKVAEDGKELLLIEFDRYYTPTLFGINGQDPIIILEIKNVSLLREELAAINTGGNFIRLIRSSMDPQTRSALIVLNMAPEKNYFVHPTFYKKENMYSLEISQNK